MASEKTLNCIYKVLSETAVDDGDVRIFARMDRKLHFCILVPGQYIMIFEPALQHDSGEHLWHEYKYGNFLSKLGLCLTNNRNPQCNVNQRGVICLDGVEFESEGKRTIPTWPLSRATSTCTVPSEDLYRIIGGGGTHTAETDGRTWLKLTGKKDVLALSGGTVVQLSDIPNPCVVKDVSLDVLKHGLDLGRGLVIVDFLCDGSLLAFQVIRDDREATYKVVFFGHGDK